MLKGVFQRNAFATASVSSRIGQRVTFGWFYFGRINHFFKQNKPVLYLLNFVLYFDEPIP